MKHAKTPSVATICIQVFILYFEGMILSNEKASSTRTGKIVRCRCSVCDVMCRRAESGGDWGDPCWGDKWGHRGCRGGLGSSIAPMPMLVSSLSNTPKFKVSPHVSCIWLIFVLTYFRLLRILSALVIC